MSKRDLKKYLSELDKPQLEDQIIDLYRRFKEVKTYYNFAFAPKEEKLLEDAKIKIGKEYFPTTKRRPKARRSIAQKIIKHWLQLGVNPSTIAELMLYNLEIAQQFAMEKEQMSDAFCKSMLNSFVEAITFIKTERLQKDFASRLQNISNQSRSIHWINEEAFRSALQTLEAN